MQICCVYRVHRYAYTYTKDSLLASTKRKVMRWKRVGFDFVYRTSQCDRIWIGTQKIRSHVRVKNGQRHVK